MLQVLFKTTFFLTHSFPRHPFSTLLKHQYTYGFFMFSLGRETVYWKKNELNNREIPVVENLQKGLQYWFLESC